MMYLLQTFQAVKLPILKKLPGSIDEVKERFCLLLILRQMASGKDSENQDLNHLYECLAVAIDKNDLDLFVVNSNAKEVLKMIAEGRPRPQEVGFQLYGSLAEDLNVHFSDFDFMVFPTADELMIDDELIEYVPSNPLHVRIRGTGRPLLQYCLIENTEYVATSALKNFHPAIFGLRRLITNNADDVVQSVFVPTPPGFVSASVNNNMTSPAVKYTVDLPSHIRKVLNRFELAVYKHIKGGEEESIVDCPSSSEDGTEYIDSLFSESKVLVEFIPAFRCLTWPMVAQEWRKRQRKWPSPDVVDQVIREGFHLVVKAPKNGGNPECDFRISFSHAEYLLSQEINEIQRECYRSLKTYHRVYLSTEPKGLISFHLKNIFLRTIEETGGEMWIESRRAECMWKLFANLLKALRETHLPHYFVRSYNLFGIDYIEDPAILESLTQRVEQIMENPVKFAEELILATQSERSSPFQEEEINSPSNQLQSEQMLFEQVGLKTVKKACLGTMKDLSETANNAGCILENLDPTERTVVEDLREIQKKWPFIDCSDILTPLVLFLACSTYTERNLNDINLRHHVLACVKQVTNFHKNIIRFCEGEEEHEDLLSEMLNPASETFDWNLFLPPGRGLEEVDFELVLTDAKCALKALLDVVNSNEDDIPLD